MTPSDDDFGWLLRRELHAEAARLTPAQDGLRQIRGRLGSRPAFIRWWGGVRVDAQRYGLHARHLLAEAADGLLGSLRWVAGRSSEATRDGARQGIVWLRPVVALAAVCIFAGTAAAVPGVRHAITNIGSSGTGSTTSVNGHGGSGGGSGTGTGVRQGSRGPAGQGGGASTTASPTPTPACGGPAKPVPSASPSGTEPGEATATPVVTPTAGPASATPAITPTVTPTATGSGEPGSPAPSDSSTPRQSSNPHDTTHLSSVQPCSPGPTPPEKGTATSNGASQMPTALLVPDTSSAPASTPSTPGTPHTPSISSDSSTPSTSAPASPSATPTGAATSASTAQATKSGSPWSAGFQKVHGCRNHHQLHC